MLEYLRNKRILVVVAHPDDEVLGLGGSMNLLIEKYCCDIRVVILGEGITSRSDTREEAKWSEELKIHRENVKAAQGFIGYNSVGLYNLPDNRFDTVALLDIVKIVEKEKLLHDAEVVFTHHGGDVNIDHQRTFEAVITACRPMQHEKVKTIITFETPSGTEWRASSDPKHFIPNYFIGLKNSNIEAKISAMESYEYEKRTFPHPRSPEALRILAQRWGVVIGKELAEAFSIVRIIN